VCAWGGFLLKRLACHKGGVTWGTFYGHTLEWGVLVGSVV